MKRILITGCIGVALAASLSSCSTITAALDIGQAKGAEANDLLLEQAEQTICFVASVGSVERRYNTEAYMAARAVLCNKLRRITITPP